MWKTRAEKALTDAAKRLVKPQLTTHWSRRRGSGLKEGETCGARVTPDMAKEHFKSALRVGVEDNYLVLTPHSI